MACTAARVHIGMDICTLCRLLKTGQLCVSDIQCLDAETKQLLRRACLASCSVEQQGLFSLHAEEPARHWASQNS